jgi:hypothetical protein
MVFRWAMVTVTGAGLAAGFGGGGSLQPEEINKALANSGKVVCRMNVDLRGGLNILVQTMFSDVWPFFQQKLPHFACLIFCS